jgi:Flp pilus assembly protein TadD
VTVAALLCAVAIIVAARGEPTRAARTRLRVAAVIATLGAAGLTAVALAGNLALTRAESAARSGSPADVARFARAAAWWQPWSAKPLLVLGQAQLAAGDVRSARRSFAHAVRLAPQDWRAWYELGGVSPAKRAVALRRVTLLDPLALRRR